jgi:hypothetical protein
MIYSYFQNKKHLFASLSAYFAKAEGSCRTRGRGSNNLERVYYSYEYCMYDRIGTSIFCNHFSPSETSKVIINWEAITITRHSLAILQYVVQ